MRVQAPSRGRVVTGSATRSTRASAVSPQTAARDALAPEQVRGPIRTCVGCRSKGPQSDLVRLARISPISADTPGASVVVDEKRGLPGRGAWLHPQQACLDLAVKRGTIVRGLRMSGNPDLSQIYSSIASHEAVDMIEQQASMRRERDDKPMGTR